ncbi:MAG: Lrp/AsnC family transcriptional regulator [Acidobacteriota bacterium]
MRKEHRELLRELETNARQSTAELARKLKVSRSTVQNRLERLEESGIIAGYTIRYGPEADRDGLRAHVMVRVNPNLSLPIRETLRKRTEIRALYSISGEYDLIAVVEASSPDALLQLLDCIRGLDGVLETNTSVLLSALLNR